MQKTDTSPKATYLKDYQPPNFFIRKVDFEFVINETATLVSSKMQVERNEAAGNPSAPLVLNGTNQILVEVKLNGEEVEHTVDEETLTIPNVPDAFTLEVQSTINPKENYSLEGMYSSTGVICTQNEPHGFRNITYFIDRPDNMSLYTTKIIADKETYPVLLSNGNKIDEGDLNGGKHFVTWEDPFLKPCYLFALVAGDLGMIEDTYHTMSGRDIDLKIYVDKGMESRAQFAMEALKKAMKWDEDTYGLECDLDIYMIVAVDAFNQGAMENKGLNIFNTACVMADPKLATDAEYRYVQGVVAHEYFHNWTGNRVTCRDWFQLTLKEGLTVFRDQTFSEDMGSLGYQRIGEMRVLKEYQFPEDSGPNAHPIRPASYIEMNNFYTSTVYQKGAAVIRMIHTMIGKEGFRKGMDKYFELYDGQAVTCEEFVNAMSIASGQDFTQFMRWYSQAGTPTCSVESCYDDASQTYHLTVKQSSAPSPGQDSKEDFYFPLSIALYSDSGETLKEEVLHIKDKEETFKFENISSKPIPSLLRDFSAPVRLKYDYSVDELQFLMTNDSDPIMRYDASERLSIHYIEKLMNQVRNGEELALTQDELACFGALLKDSSIDNQIRSELLPFPSLASILEPMDLYDIDSAKAARDYFLKQFAIFFKQELQDVYEANSNGKPYEFSEEEVGRRAIKNMALVYLRLLEDDSFAELALNQYKSSDNMTEQIAALGQLCHSDSSQKNEALNHFKETWQKDALAINKWFEVQASSRKENVIDDINRLESDPLFDKKNPNKIRSLYGRFGGNLANFHNANGEGYKLMTDVIVDVNTFNPMIASRLATVFKKYSKLDSVRKPLMEAELNRILAEKDLSPGVYEIVSKTLAM